MTSILTFSAVLKTVTYISEITNVNMKKEEVSVIQSLSHESGDATVTLEQANESFISVNTEEELQKTIADSSGQEVVFIKIANDIVANNTISIDKRVTIDLAGHKIEGNGKDLILNIETTGELNLESTEKNGKIINGGKGAIVNDGTATIKNITIEQNSSNHGGAIYNKWESHLTLCDVKIKNNMATSCGGAIYNEAEGSLKLTDVEIVENTARCGGAIYSEEDSFLKFKNVKIVKNTAKSDENGNSVGGGIYSYDAKLVDFRDVTVNNNMAYRAGGIYMHSYNADNSSQSGQCKFKNVTVNNNSVASAGGGMQLVLKKNKKNKKSQNKLEFEGCIYIVENICNNVQSDLNIDFDGDFYTPIKIRKNGLKENSKIGLWCSPEYISNEGNAIVSSFNKMYLPYFASNNENIEIEMKQNDDNSLYAILKK